MAAVRLVLPWSIWPIVPMLTCGLVRSNFFFATLSVLLRNCRRPRRACHEGAAAPLMDRGTAASAEGVEPTIGLEPMTSSLPRRCSAS